MDINVSVVITTTTSHQHSAQSRAEETVLKYVEIRMSIVCTQVSLVRYCTKRLVIIIH